MVMIGIVLLSRTAKNLPVRTQGKALVCRSPAHPSGIRTCRPGEGGGCGGIVGPGPPPLLMSRLSLSDELLETADDRRQHDLREQGEGGGPEEGDGGRSPGAL